MYTRKKSLGEEIFKSNPDKNPSFSSTLLDEIIRSIDEKDETNQVQQKAEKIGKKYVDYNDKNNRNVDEDEGMVVVRRVDLVEKWMHKKKVEEKNLHKRPPVIPDYFEKEQQQQLQILQDNDPVFFSSTSNSSVSSSGVLSSSSDTDYFAAVEKTKTSCFFGPSWRPKPIRTKVPHVSSVSSVSQQGKRTEDSLKSKLDTLKIYDNLKNLKQPISPGARLTSFINSIFSNGSSKNIHNRTKSGNKKHVVHVGSDELWCPINPKSASSFSRSILCNSPSSTPTSKGKVSQDISKRKVSFNPVSVVVHGESRRQYGLKTEDSKVYKNQKMDDFVVERDESGGEGEEYEDEESDCSSELFEIDHLALFGKKRFCEELPVYETTDLGKNLAIARGLMR